MIITSWEAINLVPVSNRIEPSKIINQINFIEEAEFRNYFSIEFYKKLIADLNYKETDFFEWEGSTPYSIDEKVFNFGFVRGREHGERPTTPDLQRCRFASR